MMRPLATLGVLLFCCAPLRAQDDVVIGGDANSQILQILKTMPQGGGYSATASATRDLQSAVQVNGGSLYVKTGCRPINLLFGCHLPGFYPGHSKVATSIAGRHGTR